MELKPNIALIEDERIYRETLPKDLEKLSKGEYSIKYVVENRRELFALLNENFNINMLFIDLQGVDGMGILKELASTNLLKRLNVIVISNVTKDDYSDIFWKTHIKVFELGAKSLVPKNQIDQLSEAIKSVIKGKGYFMGEEIDIDVVFHKEELKKRFINGLFRKDSIFNHRQKEILLQLKELLGDAYHDPCNGNNTDKLFYKRISERLCISDHTVRWHCEKMKELIDEKYSVKLYSLAQVLVWAMLNKQI